jgi:fumarylacetoacetase
MSWVPIPPGSHFPLANLPFGVFSMARDPRRRIGVAIGAHVLDVAALAVHERHPHDEALTASDLNALLALGRPAWRSVRSWLAERLEDERQRDTLEPMLHAQRDVILHLPFRVGDYVDFYASEHHAANLGRILRPGQPPLLPNWKHLPVGYHGRAGTVVVSGTPIVRPWGQRRESEGALPVFAPTQRLDFEAEVGFVVGPPSALGAPVPIERFEDHVFGACLVNDWSARDLQAFEYVPLGPFLAKSFATSISPWIVPLEALAAARVPAPSQAPPVLPHLRGQEPWGLDLSLEVAVNGHVLSRPPFATMYWTPAQMLAHLTSNGAALRTGDLFASGTVSGPQRAECGSLMELSWGGSEPVALGDAGTRTFLEDGDEVAIRATAPGARGVRIGFGEVRGRVVAARVADEGR